MKEHKYRAYINNPIHGTGIFKVKSINFNPLIVTVIIPNGKYIDGIELTDEVQFFEGEVKLLEYTGLNDRNEKEIYEGDILLQTVEYKSIKKKVYWKRIVGFSNGSFTYTNYPIEERNRFNTFSLFQTEEYSDVTKDWEVIGNIYHNLELF